MLFMILLISYHEISVSAILATEHLKSSVVSFNYGIFFWTIYLKYWYWNQNFHWMHKLELFKCVMRRRYAISFPPQLLSTAQHPQPGLSQYQICTTHKRNIDLKAGCWQVSLLCSLFVFEQWVWRSKMAALYWTYGSVSAGREKWPFNVLFF